MPPREAANFHLSALSESWGVPHLSPSLYSSCLGVTLLVAVTSAGAQSGSVPASPLGFSGADGLELDEGSAVIRSLDTPVREELAWLCTIAPTLAHVVRTMPVERRCRWGGRI